VSSLLWALSVLVLLGVLILVHELGHFVFARLFDVKVLRFSLGFGPRLFGFTRRETEYRLSLVPLGGYVRLLGEDPGEPIPPIDRPHALAAKPLWQRYCRRRSGPCCPTCRRRRPACSPAIGWRPWTGGAFATGKSSNG
jgi:regulator of sigma E protease